MLGTSCTEVRPAKELFQVMDESEVDRKLTEFEQTPIKQQFYDEDHKQRFMEERKGLLSNKVHMEKYPDASWAYSPERSDSEDQLEKEVMMDLLWDSYNDQTTKPREASSEERKNNERKRIVEDCFNQLQNQESF